MIKVGITGGIGSGKSLICRIFNIMGIPHYNADYFAKYLMQTDETLINAIKNKFGNTIYQNNQLNRKALANIVFNNEEKLNELNQIVHPAVFKHAQAWFNKQMLNENAQKQPLKKHHPPYAIKEAALLFETGSYQMLDITILVLAPEAVRINRVLKRDKTDIVSIKNRMNKQWNDAQKKELTKYCIYNDGVQAIIPQINQIHQKLIGKN